MALALVLTATVAVADTMTTTTSSYTFSTNLTVGSRGADVSALQQILINKGFLTAVSAPTGYFGSLTKAALAAFQAANNISPAVGYFGPITRAAIASMGGTTTTTTTSTTAGCVAGAAYSSTTGQPCSTVSTGTITTGSTEGTLDVRLASTPSDNASIRTQTDVPVYGIEFRARIADVSVQTVDLQVAVTNGGATENPATLINTIKVWDGSTLLQTIPVSIGTFTKDQNQVYYYRVSGINFVIPKDATKTLTFTFSTNSIDNTRIATIQGYNSSSVRAISGNNVSSFYAINGSGFTRTQTFLKPGNSTLTLSAASQSLRSQNYRVNPNGDTLYGVVLGTFNLKSDSGDSTLLTVNASSTASGTQPTTVYLYQGSTLLKSITPAANGSLVFNNLDSAAGSVVAQNTIQTYTIKGDFSVSTVNGTYASTTINNVVYQTPNGSSATAVGPVTNANQYVYTAAPMLTLASAPTISAGSQNQQGSTTALTATFAFNVTAQGGTMTLPANGDFVVVFATSTANPISAGVTTNVVTIPNNNIADGSTASVTVTAQIPNSALTYSGLYNAAITSVKWVVGANTITQTYGLEDYKTSSAANFIK
ncbi:MAG: peptidoglycan-binding protein [Candidatus Pacebacteria bacterium]|nr:peptidoglycan-binding protein [Candidatus Paceibacterota bacterium]